MIKVAGICLTLTALTACEPAPGSQPELKTYGTAMPVCVILCSTVVSILDADGTNGAIHAGDIAPNFNSAKKKASE